MKHLRSKNICKCCKTRHLQQIYKKGDKGTQTEDSITQYTKQKHQKKTPEKTKGTQETVTHPLIQGWHLSWQP